MWLLLTSANHLALWVTLLIANIVTKASLSYIRDMFRLKMTPHMQSPWRLLLGLLCLGLVLLGGTVAVTHTHANGTVHTDCGLCTTAHSTPHVTALPVHTAEAVVIERLAVALPPPRSQTLSRFALFTRPPPADARLS